MKAKEAIMLYPLLRNGFLVSTDNEGKGQDIKINEKKSKEVVISLAAGSKEWIW